MSADQQPDQPEVGIPFVHAVRSPYARTWPTPEHLREPYVPPEVADPVPPPILRATSLIVHVERRKPTKANPLGNPVEAQFAGSLPDELPMPIIPAQVEKAVRALAAALPTRDIELLYARGFQMAGDGGVYRAPIWEHRTPDELDPRKKVQIGWAEPEPADSLFLRGIWRNAPGTRSLNGMSKIMGGWWVNGDPDMFQVWTPGTGRLLIKNQTAWKKWISKNGEGEADVRVEDSGSQPGGSGERRQEALSLDC